MVRSRKNTLKLDDNEANVDSLSQMAHTESDDVKHIAEKSTFVLQQKKMFMLFMCGFFVGMCVQHFQYQYFFLVDCANNDRIKTENPTTLTDMFADMGTSSCVPNAELERKGKATLDPASKSDQPNIPDDDSKSPGARLGEPKVEEGQVQVNPKHMDIEQSRVDPVKQEIIANEINRKTQKSTENRKKTESKQLSPEDRRRLEEQAKSKRAQEKHKHQEKSKIDVIAEMDANQDREAAEIELTRKQVKISKMKPKKMWIPIPGSNGGHRRVPAVEIKAGKEHKSSVKVWLYDDFLSNDECDMLVKVHNDHLVRLSNEKPIVCFDSTETLKKYLIQFKKKNLAEQISQNDFLHGTMCVNKTFSRQLEKWGLKWSSSTTFYFGESKFSNVFSKLIEEATMLNQTHGGRFEITSYPNGLGHRQRNDCVLHKHKANMAAYATFLVFLNDVDPRHGGEMVFPEIGMDIKAKKGRALTWNSMDYDTGACETESSNEAKPFLNPVTNSKKYVIKRWYYYKNLTAIGKRLKQSELPERMPNTAKISCDHYDFEMCRMYDEWDFDHLLAN